MAGLKCPMQLMASPLQLKHTFAPLDEDVVERWIENRTGWQHFRGGRYFLRELPCDPSSFGAAVVAHR